MRAQGLDAAGDAPHITVPDDMRRQTLDASNPASGELREQNVLYFMALEETDSIQCMYGDSRSTKET